MDINALSAFYQDSSIEQQISAQSAIKRTMPIVSMPISVFHVQSKSPILTETNVRLVKGRLYSIENQETVNSAKGERSSTLRKESASALLKRNFGQESSVLPVSILNIMTSTFMNAFRVLNSKLTTWILANVHIVPKIYHFMTARSARLASALSTLVKKPELVKFVRTIGSTTKRKKNVDALNSSLSGMESNALVVFFLSTLIWILLNVKTVPKTIISKELSENVSPLNKKPNKTLKINRVKSKPFKMKSRTIKFWMRKTRKINDFYVLNQYSESEISQI